MTHAGIAWWWYLMVGLMFATWVAMMVWADWRDHQEWDRWYAWQKERDALERMSDRELEAIGREGLNG